MGLHFLHGRYPCFTASPRVWKNTLFSLCILMPDLQSNLPNILPGAQPANLPGFLLIMVLPFFSILYDLDNYSSSVLSSFDMFSANWGLGE